MTEGKKKGLVVFNHGKESGPWGTKIQRMAQTAQQKGYEAQSIDYQGMYDPEARVRKLLETDLPNNLPLILVGFSMGGYVAAAASGQLNPVGLFLLAPAFHLPGYALAEPVPQAAVLTIVHGWDDELIPVEHSLRFAQKFSAQFFLLKDGHRLIADLDLVCQLFGIFLDQLTRPDRG